MFDKMQSKNRIGFIMFLCLFPIFSGGEGLTDGDDLLSLFPAADGSGQWRKTRAPETYEGEDLFLYINGGAEIYHEYGFSRVGVQDYMNGENKSLTVELYEMETPEAAFGMYTFKTGESGRPVEVGGQARLEDYYLNFWIDRYLVTVTGFEQDEATVQGILSVAKAVGEVMISGLKGKEIPLPKILALLPEEGLITESLKYFKGFLGLFNSYAFSRENVFKVRNGVKGGYEGGHDLYLLPYESEARCREIFSSAVETFKKDDRYIEHGSFEAGFWMKDRSGSLSLMQPAGEVLVIVSGASDLERAEEIIRSTVTWK